PEEVASVLQSEEMKARVCTARENTVIFLFLAVAVLIYVLYSTELLECPYKEKSYQHKESSAIIIPRVSTNPDLNHSFCTFQPLSPEDALEERHLLDTIAWPQTSLSPILALENTTYPAKSTFTILPRRGGGQWRVGDQLEVMVKMADFRGRPKKFGGDFLIARLQNLTLGTGVAGQVVDHLNGSYSIVFSLLWEGEARVEMMMVHSNEAIAVIQRLNREQPDRVYFRSLFRSGSLNESTICNVCLRPTQPMCNFTDLHTGEPWFCYKPKNLSCDTRINHHTGGRGFQLRPYENKLFRG
ncbi:NXPE family member 3-like, partial [Plectropomus leopardus]|uniref:NXPE family member 3-like n=1 Tax=Plectropomus leopardus TaxID=160734 RepID=UPI001C4D740D